MTTSEPEPSETEPQPDPPEGTLVENQGVDAGDEELSSSAASEAARRGGRPEAAGDQVEESAGQDQMTGTDDPDDPELTGAPDPRAEAGGQDSGSID